MMKGKNGEMTTQQIVTLVILILSFAVILFFLFRLNLGDETQKELCHNSVVTRSSAVIPTDAVPLECSRSYICLTEDKSCEKMTKPDLKTVEAKEEVYQVLAEEMADCWWMFGEGKVNYVGTDFFSELYCSICSQAAFDDSVIEKLGTDKLDKREFYQYLAVTNMTGQSQTYSDYLFKTRDIDKIYSGEFGEIDLTKTYFVLTGMTSEVSDVWWALGGAAVVGGIAFFPLGVGIATGVLAVGGGTGGYFLAPIIEGEGGNKHISPSLVEAGSQEFKDLNCETIATLS